MAGKENNPFDYYSSKVKRINIPIPGYHLYHKVSDEKKIDEKFIGREYIGDRLKNWLKGRESYTGSYLVTGYRGMGKSSFVGKVLNDVSAVPSKKINVLYYILIVLAICLGLYVGLSDIPNVNGSLAEKLLSIPVITFIFILFLVLSIVLIGSYYQYWFFFRYKWLLFCKKAIKENKNNCSFASLKKLWFHWKNGKIGEDIEHISSEREYNKLIIKINLGHEVLNERDILSLISKNIYDKFSRYLSNIQAHPLFSWFILLVSSILTVFVNKLFYFVGNRLLPYYPERLHIREINSMLLGFKNEPFSPFVNVFFFIVLFVLAYYFSYYLFIKLSGISTCLGNLQHLNDRIESAINEDGGPNGVVATSIFGFNLDRKRKRSYPIANVREIENELINILDKISEISVLHPRFIIIFDELDKIDPDTNYTKEAEIEVVPEFEQKASGFPGGVTSRRRKQNVLRLLANMKLFVSSANSKFIFISGRELYDAFLADLSDREFAISSIFNGVIYVESFLTSDGNQKDITSMTESYISMQLLPEKFIKEKFYNHYFKTGEIARVSVCFKLYFEYLVHTYDFGGENKNVTDLRQIESVMILLYHFSVYLSHISNGSPKKISIYFERYVREMTKGKEVVNQENPDQLFVKGHYESQYILSLGYVDQRKIGFIHYIAFPVVQSIIDNASQYGDKLLVSASFLIDHIYKHHNSGFSWRNLEHTPELLEVYRTPELREFIASIITFMKQTHLSPIISGLYQLKFRKKIAEEISMLSKFSEEISAIFNFTLDESLSVKRHYSNLLERYRTSGGEKKMQVEETSQILGGIHHILADLHLMDEEYTDAIFQYQSSIQILAKRTLTEKDKRNDLNILVQIRNMLKLGLAYERRKTCNSAYQTYSQLVCMLIDYRYIEEADLSLSYAQLKTNDWKNREAVLYDSASCTKSALIREQTPPLIEQLPGKVSFCVKGGDLITEFASQITPLKSSIIMRLSLFEDIRLIYQALLAKLFVLEKIELGGITLENLNVLESEYVFLHLSTKEEDKFIISSDFFRKLAEIMYYKNGFISKQIDNLFTGLYFFGYDVNSDISNFCRTSNEKISNKRYLLKKFVNSIKFGDVKNEIEKGNNIKEYLKGQINIFLYRCEYEKSNVEPSDNQILHRFIESLNFFTNSKYSVIQMKKIQVCNEHRQKMLDNGRYLPCYACKYYNRSLKLMMEHYMNLDAEGLEDKNSKSIIFYNQLHDKSHLKSLRANYLSLMGHSLDGLGNVMLSCSCNDDLISGRFFEILFDNIKERETDKTKTLKFVNYSLSRLEKAFLYYWDASQAFKMAGDLQETSICLKKILVLLLNYVIIQEKNVQDKPDVKLLWRIYNIQKYLVQIKEIIVNRCIRNLYSHYEFTNMAEIQRLKWLFTMQMYDEIPIHYLSLFPDVEEILYIYYQLYMKCVTNIPQKVRKNRGVSNSETLANIYASNFISSSRVENTVYERMMILYHKANLNLHVLNYMVKGLKSNTYYSLNFYSDEISIQFYEFIRNYLDSDKELSVILGEYRDCYSVVLNDKKWEGTCESIKMKMWFLEYLINDTMFCLTKILETISPFDRSTLFTNSFIAGIYQSLYEWNQMYEFVFLLYKKVDNYGESREFEIKYILRSFEKKSDGYQDVEKNAEIRKIFDECVYIIRKERRRINWERDACMSEYFRELPSKFFTRILLNIDKANIHRTIKNYLAEMALKKYRKAKEMHCEGKAYKEMINNMYFLDDDLSNDTCQFDFAVERYLINCDYIDTKIHQLKKTFKDTSIYKVESYLGTSDPERNFNFDDLW